MWEERSLASSKSYSLLNYSLTHSIHTFQIQTTVTFLSKDSQSWKIEDTIVRESQHFRQILEW
jgi:hypothetical protein